ncbi:MAG: Maf family protein [Anaerovoracaceae bacterium]
MTDLNLILASASPRRIELLKTCGYTPQVIPSAIEEHLPFSMAPPETVMYLSMIKAMSVAKTAPEGAIVVGADTLVYDDLHHKIIGKPQSLEEAYETLLSLRNRSHQVITGVCIIKAHQDKTLCFYETTRVFFDTYTPKELLAYLHTQEPYDKAGGYAIQGTFKRYISHIEGDLNNVIGFPLDRFQAVLSTI